MTEEALVLSVPSLVMDGTEDNFVQFVDASKNVPVVVEFYSPESLSSRELSPILEAEIRARGGKILLVRVDATAAREVVAALQVRTVPTVVAFIAGQLAPLFEGSQVRETISSIFDQLEKAAVANAVTGRVSPADGEVADSDESDDGGEGSVKRSALSEEAYQAMTRGEYDVALETFKRALEADGTDLDAQSGIAQISLVTRLKGKTLSEIRSRAASNPSDLEATLDVADLDLSGGHVEDACDRLLTFFATADPDARTQIRQRLLEYFVIVGDTDPRTVAARTRLANLLF